MMCLMSLHDWDAWRKSADEVYQCSVCDATSSCQASLNLHHLHQHLFDCHVSRDISPELVCSADSEVSLVDVLLKIIGR